jgi:hypothetical protein
MERRLSADLALLYALRNSIVHTGVPIFSQRYASYLGRTGADIIMDLMQAMMVEHSAWHINQRDYRTHGQGAPRLDCS